MKNLTTRYVLGIDPSGNFNEGKGTTGWAVYDGQLDAFVKCNSIQASKCKSQTHYWHIQLLMIEEQIKQYRDEGIVISMEDYILYTNCAASQINSAMETSQIIGAIKMYCYLHNVPLLMRTASQVKRRWADSILCNGNYINKQNKNYYADCKSMPVCEHERDAMRHALHCAMFELKKGR